NATNPEIATETAIVTANCLYICPVKPPRKATGTNTAESTSTIAISAPLTCSIALIVASRGLSPSSCMIRSTFSTTTIASSTTMPIASTKPNSVNVLMVKPSSSIPANVPTIAIGTASSGIRVARQLCKNINTTINTNTTASSSVWTTSVIDALMKSVVS